MSKDGSSGARISISGQEREALTLDQKLTAVDQAITLLEEVYVHLPLKRAMHGIDPLQRLKVIKNRLLQRSSALAADEIAFHRAMVATFNSCRDLHTAYLLPMPFSKFTAYLPFKLEIVGEGRDAEIIVAHIAVDFQCPSDFVRGTRVKLWNGVPIFRAVEVLGEQLSGGNPTARFARGLVGLTNRPLMRNVPPDEVHVMVGYRRSDGTDAELRTEWRYMQTPAKPHWDDEELSAASCRLAIDFGAAAAADVMRTLYAPNIARGSTNVRKDPGSGEAGSAEFSDVMAAQEVEREGRRFGYIRLRHFQVQETDKFIELFAQTISALPINGLIIDIRDNWGGDLVLAERLLQLFCPTVIEPQRAQFKVSPLSSEICRLHSPSKLIKGLDLSAWLPSLERGRETGAIHSAALEITSQADANNIGQRYYGPVVLIVNALCYSAADIFAAGFQDHCIGPVIGVGAHTGAGGANVWPASLLQNMLNPELWGDKEPSVLGQLGQLAEGLNITVAARKTLRAGKNFGVELEDFGVAPDLQYTMTREDVLGKNEGLITYAADILKNRRSRALSMQKRLDGGQKVSLIFETLEIDRLDVEIDGRRFGSVDAALGRAAIELPAPLCRPDSIVLVRGFERDRVVANRRERFGSLSNSGDVP